MKTIGSVKEDLAIEKRVSLTPETIKKFTSLKFYKDAIILRKYDDDGKVPNIKIKKIDDYQDLISSQLIKSTIQLLVC